MAQASTKQAGLSAEVYAAGVFVCGFLVFCYALYKIALSPFNTEWVLLALITVALVSRIDISLPRTDHRVSISDIMLILSILLFGAYPSIVLAGIDAAVCMLQYKSRQKAIRINAAAVCLSIFIASRAAELLFGPPALQYDFVTLLLAAGLMTLLMAFVIAGLRSATTARSEGRSLAASWRVSFMWLSMLYLAGAAAACIIVKLIEVISFYSFIISVPILSIIHFTYRVYVDKVEASNRHAEQMAELHLKTIEALAIAIDAKDEVTHDHVHRVQIYATGLARLFGLTEAEIEALRAGALLHDIGKLAVPDYILNKPGALTPAEFEKMKVHTIVGAEILQRVGFPYPVVPVVRHHHERWDGRGYPDGLKGDQIPITARILTVSDSFDAMREERQYRKAMTREGAIQLLRDGAGTIFDPHVVRTFLEHLTEFEAEIRTQRVEVLEVHQERRSDSLPKHEQGATALEKIRSAHREVITLYDIAQTIGTSLDTRDTFAVFSSRLEDIVSYTTCVLYLMKQDSTDIEAAHVSGRNAERFKGRRIAPGAGITGWVVANRHSMHNCDPRLDFDTLRVEVPETYRTATVVPLIKDDDVLGALALYSADLIAYDGDHLRLVEAVAKLASDAIANAVHHEITETSALTDLLTGLPNARALRYRFEEEADRARRHKDMFCLVMMDLDGFKAVNDQLGHQAGDHLLIDLTQMLLVQIRSSDFISRYAGDEFVALLQVSPEEVHELARRIQTAVEKFSFRSGSMTARVGVSIGWATYGKDGDTLDELLLAADRAMYADKARRKSVPSSSGNLTTGNLNQPTIM